MACRIFHCGTQALELAGSVVAAHRLSCPTACGILIPQPGIKPMSPALEGGFLTTGPPGKSPSGCFKIFSLSMIFSNLIKICLDGFFCLFVYVIVCSFWLGFVEFLECKILWFISNLEFFYFFYPLPFFLDSNYMYIEYLKFLQRSLRHHSFILAFFLSLLPFG